MLKPSRCMSPAAGFSLVELLVAITVLAVLYGLAAPSFSTMVTNNRIRTGTDGIVNGLQLARNEAIHRNTNVSFTLGSGTGWTVATVNPAATIQTRPAGETGNLDVSSLNDQAAVTFTPLGTVSGYDTTSSLTKITVASTGTGNTESLQIDIFAGGQIRTCNPAITTADDPRQC